MALIDLTPADRIESILDGGNVTPATRLEYFLQQAASEVPAATAADAGKVLTLAEDAEHSTTVVIVPEQTFTGVEDKGTYLANITVDSEYMPVTLTVIFDGQIYECPRLANGVSYGDALYTNFPFFIHLERETIAVADANSHTVKATASVPSVEPKWEQVIPALPTTDGDYKLTISDGAASWTAIE